MASTDRHQDNGAPIAAQLSTDSRYGSGPSRAQGVQDRQEGSVTGRIPHSGPLYRGKPWSTFRVDSSASGAWWVVSRDLRDIRNVTKSQPSLLT
jgi:hypothetical protein